MTEQKARSDRAGEVDILREHQRVLIDLGRYAAETSDTQKFLNDAVVRVSSALEIDHVKVMRYRPHQGDLIIEAGVGWNPGTIKSTSFSTDMASPPGRAFQTGQPVLIGDMANAPGFRVSPALRDHGIVSVINVPIFADAAAWGVLEVDSTERRAFSEDTVRFMVGVAALISLVIRRAEAQDAQSKASAATAQEIQKREVLLSELQHRVKNNFQTLLAMIALHTPNFPTEEGQTLAMKFSDAVRAMALAHDQLSWTQAGQVVQLSSYLSALASNVEVAFENVTFEVKSDELEVPIEQAVAIGLIVNELVTNSLKHAFNGAGRIEIHLRAGSGPGLALLEVKDNGKGMDKTKVGGSGIQLVRGLTEQIRGRFEQDSSRTGTTSRIIFPVRVV